MFIVKYSQNTFQRYVARHNVQFTLNHVEGLWRIVHDEKDSKQEWQKFVEHAKKNEAKWWDAGILGDITCQPVVISISKDDTEDKSNDDGNS